MKALEQLLPFVLLALAFWLLLIRPQRRRQQQMQAIQRSADVGDEVMLSSGIYGTVASLEEDTLLLELSPGVTMKVARAAVIRVVDDEPDQAPLDEPGEGTDGRPVDPDQ